MAENSEAEREFERHCVQLLYNRIGFIALTIAGGALLFWPFDYVLYSDDLIAAFRTWRIALVGLSLLALLLRRMQPTLGALIHPIIVTLVACGSAVTGYCFAVAGTIEHPWFHTSYMLPIMTAALMVSLGWRILVTLATVGAFAAGYLVRRPDQIADPEMITVVTFMTFGVAGCVIIGHMHYRLARESFYQRRELEAADRLKNELFANVSHEFRTPLMLVMVHLRALHASDLRTEAALRNCARLLLLVDQLLELARFRTREQPGRMQRLDLAHLARDVGLAFRQDLTIEDDRATTPTWGDPQQLRTVVYNLLSNAFKFSDPKTRKIRLAVHTDERVARIEVADNGIGIAPEMQSQIFERFVQAEQGATRRYGGVGLGLALVKEIARAHGGNVRVESTLGSGSTFVFEWPPARPTEDVALDDEGREKHLEIMTLARSEPAPPNIADESRPSAPATRVLIVEDDPELRSYLAGVLGRVFRIESAADGQEALTRARADAFDLVVSDLMMPALSGLDLVQAIRAEQLNARVPVLIITARSGRDARAQAYQAGADDFLPKPFDDDELLARAFNLIAGRNKERELAASNAELEERVAHRTAELRRLTAHLTRAREEERERLARELHDETGQLLTALRIDLAMARKAADAAARDETHERMEQLLAQSFDVLRRIVTELRPRMLDEMGLAAALEWYVEDFGARTGIACELDIGSLPRRDATEIAAFRIVQETLTNVARHADATKVCLRMGSDARFLSITISDDGVGFDPTVRKRGVGLLGMAERAEQIGGRFEVESAPGQGTTTRVQLPLGDAAAHSTKPALTA